MTAESDPVIIAPLAPIAIGFRLMRTPGALLKFVAKAVGNAIGFGYAGDFIVDVLPAMAKDVWSWWAKDHKPEDRRDELEAIALASGEEIRQQAAEVVKEVIPEKPQEVRQAVEQYLVQMPATIRSSLRRPSDPTGRSVSAELVPHDSNDLLKFLPRKLSKFKPGVRPLPGVDWELEQLLGVGGFGEVWKARNPHISSFPPVALKFCLDPSAVRMLRNEAGVLDRVMRQGKHPGIVQLLRTYLSAEVPCLEYEYVEGGDLTGLIREWHSKNGPPQANQAAKIIQHLAEIVGFAHRLAPPIVHRDLKPANILVGGGKNAKHQIKVADFGIGGIASNQAIAEATRGSSPGRLAASIVLGTHSPLYASPQQIRGNPPDPRDDVFALGVIWYQLLTGDLGSGRPGGTRWYQRLAEDGMPQRLLDILASCFEEDAKDRLSDAKELADHLAAALEGEAHLTETDRETVFSKGTSAPRTKRPESSPEHANDLGLDATHAAPTRRLQPQVQFEIEREGEGKRLRIIAKLEDQIVHMDLLDPANATPRKRFIKALKEKCPNIQEDELNARLIAIAVSEREMKPEDLLRNKKLIENARDDSLLSTIVENMRKAKSRARISSKDYEFLYEAVKKRRAELRG